MVAFKKCKKEAYIHDYFKTAKFFHLAKLEMALKAKTIHLSKSALEPIFSTLRASNLPVAAQKIFIQLQSVIHSGLTNLWTKSAFETSLPKVARRTVRLYGEEQRLNHYSTSSLRGTIITLIYLWSSCMLLSTIVQVFETYNLIPTFLSRTIAWFLANMYRGCGKPWRTCRKYDNRIYNITLPSAMQKLI